ncbi:M48 family metalloprotease [Ferrimonas marina]|uniref:Peptidase family M48 n=1 Tax=Ferrimonas marina TaxID=299255 RepID=A0A1M5Z5R6_9GAMM|nr:M48 family metalloprotease [Ferrimonas marina]SHI19494.1 Peptidase family M48 [Ferrimonas marina]
MSEYENRPVPENNVSHQRPLSEFAALLVAAAAGLAVLVLALGLGAQRLGSQVPVAWEEGLSPKWSTSLRQESPAQLALDELLDDLLAADPLPDGLKARATLTDSNEVNAYASFDGEILVTTALVQAMPSENALALVLAHELAHVRQRHVIQQAGQTLATQMALAWLLGDQNGLMAVTEQAVAAGFSQEAEAEADELALTTLVRLYGHLGGAEALFPILSDQSNDSWLSTHPGSEKRNRKVLEAQRQWGMGEVTPLSQQWQQYDVE